jgi:hypothetical protein
MNSGKNRNKKKVRVAGGVDGDCVLTAQFFDKAETASPSDNRVLTKGCEHSAVTSQRKQ